MHWHITWHVAHLTTKLQSKAARRAATSTGSHRRPRWRRRSSRTRSWWPWSTPSCRWTTWTGTGSSTIPSSFGPSKRPRRKTKWEGRAHFLLECRRLCVPHRVSNDWRAEVNWSDLETGEHRRRWNLMQQHKTWILHPEDVYSNEKIWNNCVIVIIT